MNSAFSYVLDALELFSPEAGLDERTATNLVEHQLRAPGWRKALADELMALRRDPRTNWCALVSNDRFDFGEGMSQQEARALVEEILAEFV